MKNKRPSIKQLASEAKIDSEEALIRLWYAGFEELTVSSDKISGHVLIRAKKILGIASPHELTSLQYWQLHFGLEDREFRTLLTQLSISLNPKSERLPKGAVAKLKKESRKRAVPEYMLSQTQGRRINHIPFSQNIDKKIAPIGILPKSNWNIVGHERKLRWLNNDEVLKIHEALVDDFATTSDPIIPSGYRNKSLLESALFRPQTSNGGELKYPTVEMSAAALLHALIHDHPFHNGNKRTALVSMLVCLDENDFLLTSNEDELFKFVLQVAMHRLGNGKICRSSDDETLAIAGWLILNSRPIERGNRPIVFRKLRHVLTQYGCSIELTGKPGSRINICRNLKKTGFFGRTQKKMLYTQIFYAGEGRELKRDTLNKIRTDLHLDEQHGIDAKAFYENARGSVSDFIVIYSKTLQRLAKL